MTAHIEGTLTLTAFDQGGRRSPVQSGYTPLIEAPTEQACLGRIHLLGGKWLFPGEHGWVEVSLQDETAMQQALQIGDFLRLRQGSKIVGTIEITKIHLTDLLRP